MTGGMSTDSSSIIFAVTVCCCIRHHHHHLIIIIIFRLPIPINPARGHDIDLISCAHLRYDLSFSLMNIIIIIFLFQLLLSLFLAVLFLRFLNSIVLILCDRPINHHHYLFLFLSLRLSLSFYAPSLILFENLILDEVFGVYCAVTVCCWFASSARTSAN